MNMTGIDRRRATLALPGSGGTAPSIQTPSVQASSVQASSVQTPSVQPPVHSAEELTAGGSTAAISHNGQTYTLRITRAGKLILTK